MTFLIPHELIQCERFAGGPFDIANSEDEQIGPHHAAIEPVRATTTLDAAEYADIWPVDFSHNLADEEFRQAKSVRDSDFDFMPSHFVSSRRQFDGRTLKVKMAHNLKLRFRLYVILRGFLWCGTYGGR